MLWRSGPIPTYQCMWYAPGMGKGTAEPFIGTIYFPSVLTWGRMKQVSLKIESKMTLLRLQCHLWTVVLKVVQISLLQLDARHSDHQGAACLEVSKFWVTNRHRTNKHPGCKGWSVCLFAYPALAIQYFQMGCSVNHTMLIVEYAREHCSLSIQGDTLDVTFMYGFLGREGSGSKDIWSSCNSPTIEKLKKNPMGGEVSHGSTLGSRVGMQQPVRNGRTAWQEIWVPCTSIWRGRVGGSQPPNGHTKTRNAAELCDNNLYSSWQKKKKKKWQENTQRLDDDFTNELRSMRWHLYMSNDEMIVYTKDDMIVFMIIFTMWWSKDEMMRLNRMMIPLPKDTL